MTVTVETDNRSLETRAREAEVRLYSHYGLDSIEHRLSADGIDVRVVEIPGNDALPPVLLLHGISSVTAPAVPLIPELGGRHIFAVDWPGHGFSGPWVIGRKDDLQARVVSILDAVVQEFFPGELDIVGHSLGGQFALYYVLARPDRVRRLVLLGAPGAAFVEVNPVFAMRLLSVPGIGKRILSMHASLETYSKNSEAMIGAGTLDGYPGEIAEVGYLVSQRPGFAPSLSSLFRALITPFGVRSSVPVTHEQLTSITVPTLIVWADEDVFLTPTKGKPSADAFKTLKVLEVHGGHAPWLNELDRTGKGIREFLD